MGLTNIAAPALGSSFSLTGKQSAQAMMSALSDYERAGKKPLNITFVLYGDRPAHKAFAACLSSRSYLTAPAKQSGERKRSWANEEFERDCASGLYTNLLYGRKNAAESAQANGEDDSSSRRGR